MNAKFRWHYISVWSIVYLSCKFEMYILKIAQYISENVRIAFLYVLSIYSYARFVYTQFSLSLEPFRIIIWKAH